MAAYAQYGCGYPSANQYLTAGTLTTLPTHHPISQSPIATTPSNAPSISPPSHGHDSNVSGDNNSGTLTPDPASQTSTATMGTASVANGTSSTDSGNAYSCAAATNGAASVVPTLCCDNGQPMMTDPISGQTVCSCQYDPARLALSSYARMQTAPGVGVGVSVYGAPYPSNEQNPYPSIGVDSGTFYSSLTNPYALKEGSGSSEVPGWSSTGLQPSTGYYTYDPTFGAYGYGASYDLAARRKNATRESTATLKAWLSEHKKNPYPTKGEKIMLAIITKMTLTQVSTWFANARRRLKKENKMTWEPKNRTEDDDDDALASDDDKERDDGATERRRHGDYSANNANNTNNSNSSNNNNSAAGADLAATISVATTPVAGIAGAVGSHSAVTVPGPAAAPAPVPGAGAGVGGCVVSVVQPKDSYQPPHVQYARHLYYSTGNASQHFQALQLPAQRHQQQQPSSQRLPVAQTQSAIAALSQHVAESAIWQQQQQRQQH